jgi:nicotinate-nucleotide pyrophosphorylase
MQAIEFQAKVKDGSITIPEQYRDSIKGNVRVILLAEDTTENLDMIEYLLANPLNVRNFKPFTRKEIYERR